MATVTGDDDNNVLTGSPQNDTITGLAGNDTLSGLAGNDLLDGGTGADAMSGGLGDDTYIVDETGDTVTEQPNEGNDTVETSLAAYTLTANVENLTGTGTVDQALTGNALRNVINGGAGVDVLAAGDALDFVSEADADFDLLNGEAGDDTINYTGGTVRADGGEGDDLLVADFSLVANGRGIETVAAASDDFIGMQFSDFTAETVQFTGIERFDVTGTQYADTITTGGGDDIVEGGAGNDTITTGAGADTVVFDADTGGSDTVNTGEGLDTVEVSGATQVRLTFRSAGVGNGNANDPITDPAATGIVGDDLLNVRLQAEDGAGELTEVQSRFDDEGVTFVGTGGTLFDVRDTGGAQRGDAFTSVTLGTSGADTITPGMSTSTANYYVNAGQGNDTVTAADGNDFLVGGAGDDMLNGAGGDDTFIGGAGNDTIDGGTDSNVVSTLAVGPDASDDTVIYTGALSGYEVTETEDGFTVTDTDLTNGDDGTDTLTNVELLQFGPADNRVVLDADAPVRLFNAANDLVGTFGTIQAAVEASADDFTIRLDAGTYREQVLIDNKDITIIGEGVVTLEIPDRASITSSGGFFSALTILNSDVSVDNLDIDGRGQGGGNFAAETFAGIVFSNSDGEFTNSSVTGFRAPTVEGSFGYGVLVRSTGGAAHTVSITDNVITDNEKNGIDARGSGVDVTISGNTVSGSGAVGFIAQNGIALVNGATGTISGNEIDQLGFLGTTTAASGILLFNAASDVVITDNTVTMAGASSNAIALEGTDAGTITGNAVSGATIGILQRGDFDTPVAAADSNTFDSDVVTNFRFSPLTASTTPYTVSGTVGDDILLGGAADDILSGLGGDDTINGRAGADAMDGGAGDDSYVVDNAGDTVVELAGGDTDTVTTALATYTLSANVENLTGTGTGQTLTGNGEANVITSLGGDDIVNGLAGNDTLTTGGGNDTIDGGTGADAMTGGAGNDIYFVDDAGDSVTEAADAGTDEVRTTLASYTLDANVEVLTGLNSTGQVLTGNALRNTINGGSGNDTLDAGDPLLFSESAIDTLNGNGGDDTFIFDGGSVLAQGGDGNDTLDADFSSFTSGVSTAGTPADGQFSNFVDQTVMFNGIEQFDLTGSAFNDTFVTGAGDDTIDGGAGNDTLTGGAGDDIITGGTGDDTVNFNVTTDGADTVNTGEGLDVVNVSGAAGQVRLTFRSAGVGNGNPNDPITTPPAAGIAGDDLLNVRLQAENGMDALTGSQSRFDDEGVTFVAAAGITFDVRDTGGTARGDAFGIVTLGTSGNDSITPGDVVVSTVNYYVNAGMGNDTVNGAGGADFLVGGAGNDTLNGNAGIDSFLGGAGNDVIDGGTDADKMDGGDGDDTYFVDDAGDMVTDSSGNDTVNTSVSTFIIAEGTQIETINFTGMGSGTITGNGDANIINGGAGDDMISGNGGNDTLSGGGGNDTLDGGEGDDTLDGGAGNDRLTGGGGNDFFRLEDGGDDIAIGDTGNDGFIFGGALTRDDTVNGGAGNDQIGLQGDYAANMRIGDVSNIEAFILFSSDNNRFGLAAADPSVTKFSYNLSTSDANVAAGQLLIFDGSQLKVGENFTFDGSRETDGNFLVYGGAGIDTFTGGAGDDGFIFRQGSFGSGDSVNGGAGFNSVGFRGNFADGALDFTDSTLVNVSGVNFISGQNFRFGETNGDFNYDVSTSDGNVVAGQLFTVDAGTLTTNESLSFDGSAETNGSFRIFGGAGADTLTGGAGDDSIRGGLGDDDLTGGDGSDTFIYRTTTEADGDLIVDLLVGDDKIDLSQIDADQTSGSTTNEAFTFVGSNAFSGVAGELRIGSTEAGSFIEGDIDGDGVADFSIGYTVIDGMPVTAANFIL